MEDIIYFAKILPSFIGSAFHQFFDTRALGRVSGETAACLLLCLSKILPDSPQMRHYNDDRFIEFGHMIRFMVSADIIVGYNPYKLFEGDKLSNMLEFMTNYSPDETIKLFFFAIFSSSKEQIPDNYTTIILNNLYSSKVKLEFLDESNRVPYLRALSLLLKKIKISVLLEFLETNQNKFLEDLMKLMCTFYNQILSIQQISCSINYFCRILIYTTTIVCYIAKVIPKVGKDENLIEKLLNCYVVAAKVIRKIKVGFGRVHVNVFIFDHYNNQYQSALFWLGEVVYNLKASFSNMLGVDEFNTKYNRQVEDREILRIFTDL